MRAVQYDLVDPAHPASLVEVEEPALPRGDWARIAVSGGGICGSDLHLFERNMGGAPALAAAMGVGFPFVLGHEIAGVVESVGPECDVAVGTRVAVLPDINCEPRGIDPPCPACGRGWPSGCHNAGSGVLTPGSALGFTTGLGGGWADLVVAHDSMLFPLPDAVSDHAATLHEPVSIAVHGLLRAPIRDGDPVLVIGAAIIGLATVAAVRALFPSSPVTVLARHDRQADAAPRCRRRRGRPRRRRWRPLRRARRARWRPRVGTGGHVDAHRGLPVRRRRGGLLQHRHRCAAPGRQPRHHAAPRRRGHRRVRPLTTVVEGGRVRRRGPCTPPIRDSTARPTAHSIARALEILADGYLPSDAVITHEFPLEAHRDSDRHRARDRAAGAIKVVFRPAL